MINRVIIRSKVVQVAYAYLITREKSLADTRKELLYSLDKSYELYHALLQLMVELTDLQARRLDANRNKYLPTQEDLNPNTRFVDNRFIAMLRKNADYEAFRKEHPFTWDVTAPDFLRRMLDAITASDIYREYMEADTCDEAADCEVWRALFKNVIAPSEDLEETLEGISLYWNEDLNAEATFVLKTIKQFRSDAVEAHLLPMYKDEEDSKFAIDLLTDTLTNEEEYREYITRFTRNWEIERIAFMDVVIMMIAISEIKTMPSIPTVVTLNEYIELAKIYSTDQSGTFVNGILDAIVKELKKEHIINKD